MRIIFVLILPVVLFLGCDTQRQDLEARYAEQETTTYILVRHAEKDYGDDPVLTEEGTQRATALMEMLQKTDLDIVYSSDTRRTRMTAAPTAKDHGLKTKIYDAALIRDFAAMLKRSHKGKTVLVVGHSNTTPALANFLTDTDSNPRFNELDYRNILVVTLPAFGKPRVLKLRF